MVKFSCSALAARALQVGILGTDLTPLTMPCFGGIPYKIKEDCHKCQLSGNLSQAKSGRLATDVSSGAIFLTKKKKIDPESDLVSVSDFTENTGERETWPMFWQNSDLGNATGLMIQFQQISCKQK